MQTYTRYTVSGPVVGTSRALVEAAAEAVENRRRTEGGPLVPVQRLAAYEHAVALAAA